MATRPSLDALHDPRREGADGGAVDVRAAGGGAGGLEELVRRARRCLACPELVTTRRQTAAAWALGPRVRLADVRGVERIFRGRLLLATYHPSAALRFGPNGAPRTAPAADLGRAAELVAELRAAR